MSRTKATQMPLPTIDPPALPPPRRGRRPKGEARLDDVTLISPDGEQQEQPATLSKLLHSTARTEHPLRYISPSAIDPNPHQPRRSIDEVGLQQLIASIRERGILQPILVARGNSGGQYVLVAGQRRLEAARRLGLTRIPAMIIDKFDSTSVVDALIENIQRVNLSDMDEGETFRLLQEEYKWTQEEIARRIGKDQSYVSNRISVVRDLTPLTKQLIAEASGADDNEAEENMTRVIFYHTVNRALVRLPAAMQEVAVRELIANQPNTTRKALALIRRYKQPREGGNNIDVSINHVHRREWRVEVNVLQTAALLNGGSADGEALLAALEADLVALREQRSQIA
ncbi:MAG: hypothetical protein DLM69_02365 [Candidatus Chloroheliales bacterium]|nr:MAG: hypothetical protein DLM69_02365 [Chloroflexota bacterium]